MTKIRKQITGSFALLITFVLFLVYIIASVNACQQFNQDETIETIISETKLPGEYVLADYEAVFDDGSISRPSKFEVLVVNLKIKEDGTIMRIQRTESHDLIMEGTVQKILVLKNDNTQGTILLELESAAETQLGKTELLKMTFNMRADTLIMVYLLANRPLMMDIMQTDYWVKQIPLNTGQSAARFSDVASKTPALKVDVCTEVPDGMSYIPGGSFMMGSGEGQRNEKPVHQVYLDAFYIDKTEVTVESYKAFIAATNHRKPGDWEEQLQYTQRPVVNVSWDDANAFAKWAGKRLPAEAEWEYAARGTLEGRQYPWGDVMDASKANCSDGLKDVASYPSNGYGLYDMASNVHEWCADWFSGVYYYRSPVGNPKGPELGRTRVVRGGAWPYDDDLMRCSNRNRENPDESSPFLGFRCAQDL